MVDTLITTADREHAAEVSKFYRQTYGLSQAALGKKLGYQQGLISAIEMAALAAPKALVRAILALEDDAPAPTPEPTPPADDQVDLDELL